MSWAVPRRPLMIRAAASVPVAMRSSPPGAVNALIAAGANVHHVDNDGATALSCATAHDHPEIVAILEARIAELAALEAAEKAKEKDSKKRKRRA